MRDFSGKIAVVTGGGSGIGRELARQLVARGCHVAICDLLPANLEETVDLCIAENPSSVEITSFRCDVADEAQVRAFTEHVRDRHATDHINVLINNAGINGGGSFVSSPREEWERTFAICWSGVYLVTRAFLPLLMASPEGHVVNMSSANAIRAVLGGNVPHTAYSTAKFAIRGFSEALIHDFRFNAPHLGVSVVMPGHTGTGIILNSLRILGRNQPAGWTDDEVRETRSRWQISGVDGVEAMSDEQIRNAGSQEIEVMQEHGLPPAEVARIILDGIQQKQWRILIGRDTEVLDQLVRDAPERAYDPDFVHRWRQAYQDAAGDD